MKKTYLVILLFFFFATASFSQEVKMEETAALEQIYGEITESENLLPFNDLNVEFGYVLYESEITSEEEEAILEVENIRDYAVVYLNGKLQGTMTENRKRISMDCTPGKYTLQLYVENIGRITYGPEILDNSKGIFGSITLDDAEIENWKITPLNVRDCNVEELIFTPLQATGKPSFHRGYFDMENPHDTYLDISGWGMGEVWINGNYMGSYWEEEKQQSIQIPAENLQKEQNEIIIFELKNNAQKTVKLSENAVFK